HDALPISRPARRVAPARCGPRRVRRGAAPAGPSLLAPPARPGEPPRGRGDGPLLGPGDGAHRREHHALSCRVPAHQQGRPGGRLLVEEKSKSTRATAATQQRGIEQIIKAAIDRNASDLHIKAGDVFRARIDGKLVPFTKQRLTPEQTRAIAQHLIANDEDRARLDKVRDYDCSWGMPGVGRFRVNILRQRSSFMIVMRVIPFDVPTFDTLKLPAILPTVAAAERGLILVTGLTGSGKSSTMAAIVNHINQTQYKHVVTLENPIEFLHRDINSSVTQREIGVDTDDFRAGLHAALRQDPDVVMIGEMEDAETIDTALKAAETGHLVISSLHTPDAVSTITRVVSMFPTEE